MTRLHGLYCIAGGLLQLGDQAVNLACRFAGALRQLANLVGHHGKAATHFTRARSFNGRVEGQ
ncbi:hypothetical protein D3C77_787200 [compost metagenome]